MRVVISAIAAALTLLMASQVAGRAGLEPAPVRIPALEVLVFEHADCVYCSVFRRDLLAKYRQAVRADAAPLRFIDIETGDTAGLSLNARIDTVPTTVVMRDGREVDRIVGYWGTANFFKLLSHILARMQ